MEFDKNLKLTDEQLESVNGGLTMLGGNSYVAASISDAANIYGVINGYMQTVGITADDASVSGLVNSKNVESFMASLLATGLVTSITKEEATLLFTYKKGMLFKSAQEIETYLALTQPVSPYCL